MKSAWVGWFLFGWLSAMTGVLCGSVVARHVGNRPPEKKLAIEEFRDDVLDLTYQVFVDDDLHRAVWFLVHSPAQHRYIFSKLYDPRTNEMYDEPYETEYGKQRGIWLSYLPVAVRECPAPRQDVACIGSDGECSDAVVYETYIESESGPTDVPICFLCRYHWFRLITTSKFYDTRRPEEYDADGFKKRE